MRKLVCCCGRPLNGDHDHNSCGPPVFDHEDEDTMISNETKASYQLSIFAANMLLDGIRDYAEATQWMFDNNLEDGDYCSLRTFTNIKEAEKLLDWFHQFDTPLVDNAILCLKGFLCDLEEKLREFNKIGIKFKKDIDNGSNVSRRTDGETQQNNPSVVSQSS